MTNVVELEPAPRKEALALGPFARRGARVVEPLGQRLAGQCLPIWRFRLESQRHQRFGDSALSQIDSDPDRPLTPRDTRAHEHLGEARIGLKPVARQVIQRRTNLFAFHPFGMQPVFQLDARVLTPSQKSNGHISRGGASGRTVPGRSAPGGIPIVTIEHRRQPPAGLQQRIAGVVAFGDGSFGRFFLGFRCGQ